MGFFKSGKRGTVTKQRFNCRGACKRLYEGMKGFGTNEDAITEIVAGHTARQRQEIKTKYKIMYGKDLIKELDSELSGSFGKLVLSLMKDPEEYILESIRNAVVKSRGDKLLKKMQRLTAKKRLCSDAYTLLGILCLRSNQEVQDIKDAYKMKYETELEEDVGQDFPDEFRSLIFGNRFTELGIICAGRDESSRIDMRLVQEDIESLQNGVDGSTPEEHFQSCFEERSWIHLRKLYDSYMEATGVAIEDFVEKSEVFSDTMKESYKTLIKIVRNAPDFYAERLKDAIEGLGTDDDTLINVVVLRSEIDLVDVIERYEVLFGNSLEEDVVGDTSGDYKNILLKLLTIPEDDDEEEHEHHHGRRRRSSVMRLPGVEMCTQTEEEEKPHVSVNAADEDGHEAVGHEVEEDIIEEDEEDEIEEEEVTAAVEEVVEEAPPVVEVVQEPEDPKEEVQEEMTEEPVIVEEASAAEEAKVEVEETSPPEEVAAPPEEEVTTTEEITAEPAITQEVGEEEKKKAEDVDNAEGG